MTQPEPHAGYPGAPTIPGYEVEDVVGSGATGVVYRARQLAFDRPVALKVLLPGHIGRVRAVRRLQREARLAARLSHPNLVSSIDMGEADGRWWHAMELVEGPSLAILIHKEGRLTERTALRIFAPLADALAHMAASGVVHRDIKPGNVLIERGGRPLLVDFGLAFSAGDPALTRAGGTLGTPHYISPEQARDPSAADTRSDIWSLGATLYHAVCGVPPFQGESVAEILSGVLYADVLDPRVHRPELSKGLTLVLRKCLVRDPARRYQHPLELCEDFERLRERRAVRVRRSELDPVAREGSARRPLVAAVVGLAVVLAAIFAWGPWRSAAIPTSDAPHELAEVEPFDELTRRVRADVSALGGALRDLAALQAQRPPGADERAARARAELEARLAAEIGRREAAQAALLTRDLRESRYASALARLDGFRDQLAAELGLDAAQRAMLELDLDLERERRRIDEALASHMEVLGSTVATTFDVLLGGQVEERLRRNEWRSAHRLLERDPGAWLAEHVALPDLPPASLAELVGLTEQAFAASRRALIARWEELDQQLSAHVAGERALLEDALLEGRAPSDPAAALRERFDTELARRGIERGELLDGVAGDALQVLAASAGELAEHARAVRLRDAEAWLAEREAEAAELARARRFGELVLFWERHAAAPEAEPVRDALLLRRRAARLQDELLVAVADALRRLRGQRVVLVLGGVLAQGELALVGDPLQDGFELDLESGVRSQRLRLRPPEAPDGSRVLEPAVLAQLLTLAEAAGGRGPDAADERADVRSKQRLALALLHVTAGDVEAAATLIVDLGGEGFADALDARLAVELRERIERSRLRDAAHDARQREEAQALIRSLDRLDEAGTVRDRQSAVAILDRLLGPLAHVDVVNERKADLRALRRELTTPQRASIEERLRAAFEPTRLELNEPVQRTRLVFDFSQQGFRANDVVGAWRRPSDWLADSGGWKPSGRAEEPALHDDARWPSLALSEPLATDDAGVFLARLRVRQLADAGEPRLCVVTVAGWHVAFASAGQQPRWSAETGGSAALEQLVANVAGGGGRAFPGFENGRTYVIELRISGQSGRLRVELFEITGFGQTEQERSFFSDKTSRLAPAPGSPETRTLVFRALVPVRLERVELEGAYK